MAAFFASGSSYSNGGATTEGTGGGIVFSHGAEWREQRRFALRNLKDKVQELFLDPKPGLIPWDGQGFIHHR